MARLEEQLAPNRPSLTLLTLYTVARSPPRSCGPLLPRAEYSGLVKAASHGSMLCNRLAAMAGAAPQMRVLHAEKSLPCPRWRTELA